MKLEIHIPQLDDLNHNVRQLIDTLNDLAVVGINAVKREDKPAATTTRTAIVQGSMLPLGHRHQCHIGDGLSGGLGVSEPASEEKPKRTRKAKAEEPAPAPDNGTGAEVITYTVGEHGPASDPNGGFEISQDLRDQIASSVSASQPEQPAAAVEPEPQPEPEATTLTLADCTALATPLQSAGKLDQAKTWLKEHGADRLKDLDPSHYGAFITFAKGLLG